MGYTRWSDDDWKGYSSVTSTKPASAIFTKKAIVNTLDPKGVVMRESRDSVLNPTSNAIIVGVDVTGSMGMLADYFIKTGLGTLFTEILDRKPVQDPHLMFMAIGDAAYDASPLQVSQFEADITIAKQLEDVHIEKGGGGNGFESYELPWYFAAYHTSIDCFEKRNKKGYLFTLGDEETPPAVIRGQVEKFIGDTIQADIPIKDMYEIVNKMYNVYHIMVAEGSHMSGYGGRQRVIDQWTDVMGEHAILLTDHKALSEVIVSIIEVNEGATIDAVTASWSGDTSLVVATAISGLATGVIPTTPKTGSIIRF